MIDWDAFDDAHAEFTRIMEAAPCWYCGKAMGPNDPLYLDDAWACHPTCAPAARAEFGMTVSMNLKCNGLNG
jgi:hypothetical protein